jgi:hypothetical protein
MQRIARTVLQKSLALPAKPKNMRSWMQSWSSQQAKVDRTISNAMICRSRLEVETSPLSSLRSLRLRGEISPDMQAGA